MKQLGNLAIICARRPATLLQIIEGRATVHIGIGPKRKSVAVDCDDDGKISELIYELNYGKLSEKEAG